MAIHRIQLKGPWGYRPLEHDLVSKNPEINADSGRPTSPQVDLPLPSTVKFPIVWADFLGDYFGTVEIRRPFNRPTNLSANERVDLIFEDSRGISEILLNGISLGNFPAIPEVTESVRFDVTTKLRLHNEIRVRVVRTGSTPAPCGIWGTVCLEICDVSPK